MDRKNLKKKVFEFADERDAAINEVNELLLVSQIAAERKLRFRRRFSKLVGVALLAFSFLCAVVLLYGNLVAPEFRLAFGSLYILILSVELLRG